MNTAVRGKRALALGMLLMILAGLLVSCNNHETADPTDGPEQNTNGKENGMTSPIIYPIPESEAVSGEYSVTVQTEKDPTPRPVGCYTAKVTTGSTDSDTVVLTEVMSFCYFDYDFSSPVILTVTPKERKAAAKVLPESAGVECSYADGTLTAVLTEPVKLSVEFDGDIYHNLFVFANRIDADAPEEGDPSVIYYGPGVHDAGEIRLGAGETLYIAGGAVVYGYVAADGADGARIMGRGILDGSKIPHGRNEARKHAVYIVDSNDFAADGIIIRDSSTWTFVLERCKNAAVTDLKEICHNFNSDGFDIVSCRDVLIDGVFVRNYDDNISLKAYGDYDCRNITMQNSVLWADRAHNMLVGPEAKSADFKNLFSNVTFKNIDVLRTTLSGAMGLACSDSAVFDDITWEDVRIERTANGRLLNFRFTSEYGSKLGTEIRNVYIKNVSVKELPKAQNNIIGRADAPIRNLVIENFTLVGAPLTHEYFRTDAEHVAAFTVDGDTRAYD